MLSYLCDYIDRRMENRSYMRYLPERCSFCGYMMRSSSSGMTCKSCVLIHNYKKVGSGIPLKITL